MQPDVLQIEDLTRIDSVIFEAACRMALEADNPLIDAEALVALMKEKGLSEAQVMETEEILEGEFDVLIWPTWTAPDGNIPGYTRSS